MKLVLFLKQIVPPLIWNTIKKFKRKKKYFGLNNLDFKLKKYLDYNNGFFIELGANDGISQSNTYYFEKNNKWHGILIEPILHKYVDCKKNRSIKNNFYCNACVSFEFKDKFVELLYSNLMTIPTNLESDIDNKFQHANHSNTVREKKEEVIKFASVARTLDSIMSESQAPSIIDFLSLDVEGAEIEVLKGIDFKKYKFKYILVESRNFEKISNFLNIQDYELKEKLSHHDYLFSEKK